MEIFFAFLAALIASLSLHELGHHLFLHRYGVAIREISLGYGPALFRTGSFVLRLAPICAHVAPSPQDWQQLTNRQRAFALAGGPAASLLVAVAFALAWLLSGHVLFRIFAEGNLLLAAFNLLPLKPLDGWGLVECALESQGLRLSELQQRIAAGVGGGVIWGGLTWAFLLRLGSMGGG